MDNELVQHLLFWNKYSGEKEKQRKNGKYQYFFFFFFTRVGCSMQMTDLKEVFRTLGMWSKWIVRRDDSSGSLDRASLDAHSQRHKHTCVAGINITIYSPNDTQKHTVCPWGDVGPCWGDQTGGMFQILCRTHLFVPTSWQKTAIVSFPNLFFMHNSVSEIWWDEEMVSSFPQH